MVSRQDSRAVTYILMQCNMQRSMTHACSAVRCGKCATINPSGCDVGWDRQSFDGRCSFTQGQSHNRE